MTNLNQFSPSEPSNASGGKSFDAERSLVHIAHTIRDLRHVRREEFGLALDEPAWDILVELYCRDNIGASTTTGILEDAASVPPSTGRRWIRHLEQLQYVTIRPHPTNPDVGYVEMTATAKSTLERYLTRVLEAAGSRS